MTWSGVSAYVTESWEFWQSSLRQKGGGWLPWCFQKGEGAGVCLYWHGTLLCNRPWKHEPGACTLYCRPAKPTDHKQDVTMLTVTEYTAIIYSNICRSPPKHRLSTVTRSSLNDEDIIICIETWWKRRLEKLFLEFTRVVMMAENGTVCCHWSVGIHLREMFSHLN